METIITIIIIIVVFIIIYKYLQYEQSQERDEYQKSFKINSIMKRLSLTTKTKAVFQEGLLLDNDENQIIQIVEIYNNKKVLLINRNNPKHRIKINLNKLTLHNLDNIREWILHDMYTIK